MALTSAWFLYVCAAAAHPYVGVSLPTVSPIVRFPTEASCRAALSGVREIGELPAHLVLGHPRCAAEMPEGVAEASQRCADAWFASASEPTYYP